MSEQHRTTMIFAGAGVLIAATAFAYWAAQPASTPPAPPPPPTPPPTTSTPIPPTPSFSPVGQFAAGTPVKLSGRLNNPYLLKGVGEGEVSLLVNVDAAKAETQHTASLDLAVVIDCSSSMAGQKMVDARIAAQDLVMRLRDGDRVAVIAYSSSARVEVPMTTIRGDNKATVQRRIGELGPEGATNISGALELARQTLEQGGAQSDDRVRRILLLSDGRATAGDTRPERLQELAHESRSRGVTVSTLGLGEDYNELVMTGLANKGGGNYHFISDSSQLAAAFTREFATLQNAVSRNTMVTIKLAPGVRLGALYGFEFNQAADGSISVPLGEFWSGRNASMLLRLSVDRANVRQQQLASVGLTYRDLAARLPRSHAGRVSVAVVEDGGLVEENADGEVAVRYEQFLNIAAQDEAMRRYEAGDVGGARSVLNKRKADLSERVEQLKGSGLLGEERARSFDKDIRQAEEAEEAMDNFDAKSSEGKNFLKRNRETNWSKGRSVY